MWLLAGSNRRILDRTASDLLERIQGLEREHPELRGRLEDERQLRILAAQIVGARRSRRSSGTRSKSLLERCERHCFADALAASRALAERGAISTALSCRKERARPRSKNSSWKNTNAPPQAEKGGS